MKKEDLKANAAILLTAALMYVALLSPFSVIRASGAAAAPVYRSADEGRLGLVLRLSWHAGALDGILDELEAAGEYVTFAVTPELARQAPSLVSAISRAGHEIALLASSKEEIGEGEELLSRVTGERILTCVTDLDSASALASAASSAGMKLIVPTSDLDTGRGASSDIEERISSAAQPGGFIACDPTGAFLSALPFLLESIKNMGLDIAPLYKMLYN